MKLEEEWKTYRTRFLVNAKQLTSSLTFVDHLGRQHRGGKGDYLVESSDGVISIAPRRIFEDIYVPMSVSSASNIEAPKAHIDVPKFPGSKVRRFELNRPPETAATLSRPPRPTQSIRTVHVTQAGNVQ